MLNKRGRFLSILVLIFLILLAVAYADLAAISSGNGSKCSIKNFPGLFKYDEIKNKNLATALYSISISFKEQNVKITPKLLAAVMATLEKEVGAENFLPVEENGDYGQGGDCTYKISGKCRKMSYDGGVDYKGRGYIQITHKENYAKYCGQECVGTSAPELDVCGCKNRKHCAQTDESVCPQLKALRPEYAGKIFASYYAGTKYKNSNLVQLAEKESYRTVGEKINGGQGYADDFAKKAGDYLLQFKSDKKTLQLLGCLDLSTEGYCGENSNCEPGKECNLSTHTCQYKQAPEVPGPIGCPSAYLFSCNDPVSSVLKKIMPVIFNKIVRECPEGYIYGKDRRCHPECGAGGTYCAGNSECFNGNCFDCDIGYYLETDWFCYPKPATACDPGYILGDDGFCHPECGNSGTYCIGNSQCYNGQCLGCDPGYYLATDGLCYPENGGEDTICLSGYIYGDDGLCYPEDGGICDPGYYLATDGLCYPEDGGTCETGYYLATDGLCYPEDGVSSCDPGYIPGADDYCHLECGNSGTYCIGNSECYSGQCLACDPGYYLAIDGLCYPEGGSCEPGYYLATDGLCYPEDGGTCDPGYYLAIDGLCYPDTSCNFGYILGEDGLCHKECGISDTYCIGDSTCYMGQCISCDPGYYLATDGYCYPEGGSCDPGYYLATDGLCYPEGGSCDPGYYLATDGYCYPEGGSCDPGYYLATDGYCYPEGGSCDPGYYLATDGLCYPEGGSCDPGYYLATDGYCYPENGGSSCDPGYILGADDYCHLECGNSGTYCIGNSQCFNGRCLSCNPGYYLATDGYCYPY